MANWPIVIKETFDGREMSLTGVFGDRDYVRAFWATSIGGVVDQQDILLAPGVPTQGDIYFSKFGAVDTGATCREVTVRQRSETPREWRIEARYSSRFEPFPPEEALIRNPLMRPLKIYPSTKKYTRPAFKDVNGVQILNTANCRFDPGVEEEMVNLVLTFKKNFPDCDFQQMRSYTKAINSAAWMGFPALSLKIDDITALPMSENGVDYWAITIVMEVAQQDETWYRQIANFGYEQLVAGKRVPCTIGGKPSTTPQPLDAAGKQIAVGGTPIFQTFVMNRAIAFNLLGLT